MIKSIFRHAFKRSRCYLLLIRMFKEKNSKKRIVIPEYAKDSSTLDAKHQSMIKTMTDKYEQLDQLRETHSNVVSQLKHINSRIQKLNQNKDVDDKMLENIWSSNIFLQDYKLQLEKDMKQCGSHLDEINYYENAGSILFQYYDTLNKQTNDIDDSTSTRMTLVNSQSRAEQTRRSATGCSRKKRQPLPSITILDALQSGLSQHSSTSPSISISTSNTSNTSAECDETTPVTQMKDTDARVTKTDLVDKYLAIIDSSHVNYTPTEALGRCPVCLVNLECIVQEGAMVCIQCGYQELLLVEQNRPIIRQHNKDASHYSYKRINHFREWCSQVQGRESTDIPDEVFEQILQEIQKEKIRDTKKLTYNKMREILKKLKINRYYEHINYIINRINGVPTPHFSPELEDKLCNMFREIQGPFLKHCPSFRKNFLSYSYCLSKMMQILGLNEYLPFFNLLKSREKLYLQDQIWKCICQDLGWPVYPSL